MIIIQILLGLLGLGIVILVHESGHFAAAKLAGIEVEAFSLGWGKKLIGFKQGKTEYRISIFPLGGYCRMKGEKDMERALQREDGVLDASPGSFYGAAPWKRILVSLAGPAANFVFAVLVLAIIWQIGFQIQSVPPKIIMPEGLVASDEKWPAKEAGLQSGDIIQSINSNPVRNFREIQENIAPNPFKKLSISVKRETAEGLYQELRFSITPKLDPQTGAGIIGVAPWIDPVVDKVKPGSGADLGGMQSGDRILAINGEKIRHYYDVRSFITAKTESLKVKVLRDNQEIVLHCALLSEENSQPSLGVNFKMQSYPSPRLNPAQALARGFTESVKIFKMTAEGFTLLFRGVDLQKTIAGPMKLVPMVGEIAASSFQQDGLGGLMSIFQFLSLISVALCLMNLLPIPVLDGGQILLFIFEILRRRPLKAKMVVRYQTVGAVIVLVLIVLVSFNDILSFTQGG